MDGPFVKSLVAGGTPEPVTGGGSGFRARCADFWLNLFFFHARHVPWVARRVKWFFLWFAMRYSHVLSQAPAANARRIFGPGTTPAEQRRFARRVVGNFYDFVYDVGRCMGMDRQQLEAQVESVEGHAHYVAARAAGRGAIVVTAHMGSFEVGLAALLAQEPEGRIHVVFKRDARARFERIRTALRRRLGVEEAAVDEGWGVWMRLRDALQRDEVVVLQGDRVLPGQKGQIVPFLHGHLELPLGPAKLALASGAPIVPVFALRQPDGRVRIAIEPAIWPGDGSTAIDDAVHATARVLERYVSAHPEQWLVLHKAFREDQG